MKYCVFGAGRTGQGMVAYLSNQGQEVGVWDRNSGKRRQLREYGVKMEGRCAGVYYPEVFDDINLAAQSAEILLIMTTAAGHYPVAQLLGGNLKPGQVVLILNGNMGAWEFYSALGQEIEEKNILVAETGGMLLLCDYNENGVLFLKSIKTSMNLAAAPSSATAEVIRRLSPEFPQFYPVKSIVETSLNNSNPVMHAPITLFNFTRIENGEDFGFYAEGATPCVISYIERMDSERCAILQAMGATPIRCVDIINSFWQDKYEELIDAVRNNPTYMSGKGPKELEYRYITEDIPYGLVPLSQLGKELDVPTPYLDALLVCFKGVLGERFPNSSPNISGLINAIF